MNQDRDAVGRLSEDEVMAAVERCPEELRWAFGGWLRGERLLDGDLIEPRNS